MRNRTLKHPAIRERNFNNPLLNGASNACGMKFFFLIQNDAASLIRIEEWC